MSARRSQQGRMKNLRENIAAVSLGEDVKQSKEDGAQRPAMKNKHPTEEGIVSTQDLLCRMDNILSRLTPQTFNQLVKEVVKLPINTEERLKGVIDLMVDKAISEPNSSECYANMCRCLMGLKVPTTENRAKTVNFRKVLLNRCMVDFEKDDTEMFRKKEEEMDAAATPEEKICLNEELELARDQSRRRRLGNVKLTAELFKVKMLSESIMHECVVTFFKNFKKKDEESLECLCWLLSTIGRNLDYCKSKPRMDQYFNQIEQIIKHRKISSRIHVMLQDLIQLRLGNWVPLREEEGGPRTVDPIHKLEQNEEQSEAIEVPNLTSVKHDLRQEPPGLQASAAAGGCGGGQDVYDVINAVPGEKDSQLIDASQMQKKVENSLGDETERQRPTELSFEELYSQMEKLLKENTNNQRILNWIESNLSEQQLSSTVFVQALMTSVCQSAIVAGNPCRVDMAVIRSRAKLLQKYLGDEQMAVDAADALLALALKFDQPLRFQRMFFDALYEEGILKKEVFYKRETYKDPTD